MGRLVGHAVGAKQGAVGAWVGEGLAGVVVAVALHADRAFLVDGAEGARVVREGRAGAPWGQQLENEGTQSTPGWQSLLERQPPASTDPLDPLDPDVPVDPVEPLELELELELTPVVPVPELELELEVVAPPVEPEVLVPDVPVVEVELELELEVEDEVELELELVVELEPQPEPEPEPEAPPALVLGLEPALGSSFSTDIQL